MKRTLSLFLPLFFAAASLLRAGTPQVVETQQAVLEPVPVDVVDLHSSYVFESDIIRGGLNFGSQDAFHNYFEYTHRIHLTGNWYVHTGVTYDRFDFGNVEPLPVHLQSGAGVIGIDYMRGADVGALLQFRPGFYTEDKIGINSFDCPITLAAFWTIKPDTFYILIGANAAFLRNSYPVLPVVGFVWNVNSQWRILAIPPSPKIIYSPTKNLSFWGGGEIVGGSFRTDHDHFGYFGNERLNGAAVDYVEYRAGAGFTYNPSANVAVDFSGGYAIQREFIFDRADQTYRADPAPYVRLAMRMQF